VASKAKLAVGLDLGSTSTRVVICALEEQSVKFLGYGEAPVHAWNKGRLTDQEVLSQSIQFALHEAELRAQASPESAVIGVGGSVSGVNSRGLYEFGRRRDIEPDDLRYSVELASRVRLEEDRQILQICPQDFTLDGRAGYRNPKGIQCARLEANVHVITASFGEHQGLISAVHKAHLAVEESIFEGVAAAYASILPEDRARGVALIDVGAQSTHLAVYDGDALLLATSLPIGADHFTRDVSWLLKVNYEDAESRPQPSRDSDSRRPRDARSTAAAAKRNFGSTGRRHLRANLCRNLESGNGAITAGRRNPDRRRNTPAWYVRHRRTCLELSGAKWLSERRRQLALRARYAHLDHGCRPRNVCGPSQDEAGLETCFGGTRRTDR